MNIFSIYNWRWKQGQLWKHSVWKNSRGWTFSKILAILAAIMFIVAAIWASDLTNQYVLSSCKISCIQLVRNKAVLCRNTIPQNFREVQYASLYYWLKNYAVCEIGSKDYLLGFRKSQQSQGGVTKDVVCVAGWVISWRNLGTSYPVMQHHIPAKKLEFHFELN